MKKIYFHIFLLTFLFFEEKPNNSFTSDIQFFEKEKKTVVLHTKKTHFFIPKSKKYKFKKDRYFEMVPPEYKIRIDTIQTFDTTMDYEEIKTLYKIEEVMLREKSGGWKWETNTTILKKCRTGIEPISNKSKILRFTKEEDKYTTVTVAIISERPHFGFATTKKQLENYSKKTKIATAIVEARTTQTIINYQECIKDGYLKEIPKEKIIQQHFYKKNIIKFSKGNWTLVIPHIPIINCPPTLKNIQLILKNRGYDTNTDGEETLQYKLAKSFFMKEQKLKHKDEPEFLKALGFKPLSHN